MNDGIRRRDIFKALLRFALMAGLGLFLLRGPAERPMGAALLATAAIVLALELAFSRVRMTAERLSRRLVPWAGFLIAWLLLAPCYWIVFTIAGALRRIARHDPLERKFPAETTTCWRPHDKAAPIERYRGQF